MTIAFPATRWSLIAALPDQPQSAANIVALYADAIAAYLSAKLPDERPERVADVIQDVLVELLAKPEALARAQPGSGSRFRHYIMHLAWHSALNHLRYQRRRDHGSIDAEAAGTALVELLSSSHEHPVAAAAEAMDRAWARSVVQQALDEAAAASAAGQLSPVALAVLSANVIDGKGLRGIAEQLGLSLATCSRRLGEARRFLQVAIAERLRAAGELEDGEASEVAGQRLLERLTGGSEMR